MGSASMLRVLQGFELTPETRDELAEELGRPGLMVDLDLKLIDSAPDQARLEAQVRSLAKFRAYSSPELAAQELAAMLLGVHPQVAELQLVVSASDPESSLTPVSLVCHREGRRLQSEVAVFGQVDILLENSEAGLYLLHVGVGEEIPRHHHKLMRELEWHVRGQIERDGEELSGLDAVEWPRGQVHGYRNVGAEVATVFCCDMPSFIRSDEVYESLPRAATEGLAR